jgi:phosphoglycolate phosphatase
VSLLVFDLDGTLIDSRHDLADAANALIAERGGAPLPVDRITAMVGEGAALLVRRALTAAGLDADVEEALPRFLVLYGDRLLVQTRLYDGTRHALETLAARANLAILTNKPQQPTERILDGLDVARFFRWVIGGDTAHGRKPDPAGLRHLIATAGTRAAATVMIGDSVIDLRTARAAGVRLALVRYGFGFPTTAGHASEDDLIVDGPEQLLDIR